MRERVQSLARTTLSPPTSKGKGGRGEGEEGERKEARKEGERRSEALPPTSKVKAKRPWGHP